MFSDEWPAGRPVGTDFGEPWGLFTVDLNFDFDFVEVIFYL